MQAGAQMVGGCCGIGSTHIRGPGAKSTHS
ncbi:MAG: homocysteine S-methyltransferase family protein [Gammaproteobacteria bacterium]|nr:homocysteine S-methyltransferase family protein [Gammaproteobacteria bacterium]